MGQRLRALRELHDLTQQELANLANVSKSLVSKVETDRKPGTWDLAIAVAKALRVDAAALMGDAPSDVLEPSGRITAALPAIRRALATYDCPPEPAAPARPLRLVAQEPLSSRARWVSQRSLPHRCSSTAHVSHRANCGALYFVDPKYAHSP